tara:strand:- start:102 stop:227 length:126 start_codon:yes stop_codon:yes gene_type:complete
MIGDRTKETDYFTVFIALFFYSAFFYSAVATNRNSEKRSLL